QLDGLPRALDEFTYPQKLPPLEKIYVAGGDDRVWTFSTDLSQAGAHEAGAIPIALAHRELEGGGSMFVILSLQGQTVFLERALSSSGEEPAQRFYAGQHPLACALG